MHAGMSLIASAGLVAACRSQGPGHASAEPPLRHYPNTRLVPGARVDAPRVNAVATATRTDRAGLSAHYAARQARRKHVTELSVTGDDAGWEGALPPRYRGETAARSLSWSGRGRPWWGEPGIEGQPGVALYCFRRDLRQRGDRSLVTHMSLLSRPGAWRCGGRCRKPVRGHWRVPALDHGRRQHVCVHW